MINGINSSNAGINSVSSSGVRAQPETKGSESSKIVEVEKLSKVEEIKRRIEIGEYQLNVDKTAQKLAESLMR